MMENIGPFDEPCYSLMPAHVLKRANAAVTALEVELRNNTSRIVDASAAFPAIRVRCKWSPAWQEFLESTEAVRRCAKAAQVRDSFESVARMVPSPRHRKAVRKLFADQEEEINEALKRGDLSAATWLKTSTYFLTAWYLLTDTAATVARAIGVVRRLF